MVLIVKRMLVTQLYGYINVTAYNIRIYIKYIDATKCDRQSHVLIASDTTATVATSAVSEDRSIFHILFVIPIMSSVNSEFVVKSGLAKMLKGGVIMDVVNVEQARIAQEAGAVAVMALERIPADIRVDGGVARMSDPDMIRQIKAAVTIPVMAKVRILCT